MKIIPKNEAYFYGFDNEGHRIRFDILFTYDSEITGRTYVASTDNSPNENGEFPIYVHYRGQDSEELLPVTDDAEWAMIDRDIQELFKELLEKYTVETREFLYDDE